MANDMEWLGKLYNYVDWFLNGHQQEENYIAITKQRYDELMEYRKGLLKEGSKPDFNKECFKGIPFLIVNDFGVISVYHPKGH